MNRISFTVFVLLVASAGAPLTVLAGAEDGKQAQMNFIMLADGVPQGIASVFGTCFDAPFPGVNLGIPFGSRPGH